MFDETVKSLNGILFCLSRESGHDNYLRSHYACVIIQTFNRQQVLQNEYLSKPVRHDPSQF